MKKLGAVLMIQGTSSNVGKSLLVTGLCRWFSNQGLRVAPFKAQNMALNSSVTPDGDEIGCAQFYQAEAARAPASAKMNPILLKPEGDRCSQVVLLGRPLGSYTFRDYHEMKPKLRRTIVEALNELRENYDLVLIEGAGSPAEINLKANDLVNMFVALECQAPVLLVGDIDRGGVFAAIVGTMELLEPNERELVAGFLINKFRGDASLLQNGLKTLEEKTYRPVLGVIPFLKDHGLAEEDTLGLDQRPQRLLYSKDKINIAIMRWPRLSNYDEFSSLEREKGVTVAFVSEASDIEDADLLILPGTKATIADLSWMRCQGFDQILRRRLARNKPVLAICGGYQMLGLSLHDFLGVEGAPGTAVEGLGLLPFETHFAASKLTAQVQARWRKNPWDLEPDAGLLSGYEIHMGQISACGDEPDGLFVVEGQDKVYQEGHATPDGVLLGTLIHGLFENASFRLGVINMCRTRKNLSPLMASSVPSRDATYNRLAEHIAGNCDMPALLKLLHLETTIV